MSQSKRKKRRLLLQQKTKTTLQSLFLCFIQEKFKAFSSKNTLKFLFFKKKICMFSFVLRCGDFL